jgi:hypothetical protein
MPANGWAVSELVPQGLSVKPMDSATESKPPDLLFHVKILVFQVLTGELGKGETVR